MNKNILIELKNVANSLDDNGFYKEANVISKVMVKVAEKDFITEEGRKKVYNDDLNQYKVLVDAGKTQEATNLYNGILNNFFSQYNDAMKTAWRGQADRYRLSKSMNPEIKNNIDAIVNNSIKGANTIQEFDTQWNAMMNNKINSSLSSLSMDSRNANQIKQIKNYLNGTYQVMSAKLKAQYQYNTGLKYRPEVPKPVTKGTPAPPPLPQSANRGSGVPSPSV
jgi:hypothetical protein